MRRFLLTLCFSLIGFVVLAQSDNGPNTRSSTLGISATNELLDSINATAAIEDTTKTNKRPPVIEKLTPVYNFLSTRKILWAIIVLILTYFGIRIGTNILGFFAKKSTTYRFTIKGLIPLFRFLSWGVAITLL